MRYAVSVPVVIVGTSTFDIFISLFLDPCDSDKFFSHTGYEPKDFFLTETYVEFNQESMSEQRFPEQRFSEDVDYDDAAIGEMLFNAY